MTAVLNIEKQTDGTFKLIIVPECSDSNSKTLTLDITEEQKEEIESLEWDNE